MNIEAFGAGNRMFSSASQDQDQSLLGSVLESLKKSQDRSMVNKLSIDSDPQKSQEFASVYRKKTSLIPPEILKQVRNTEELVGGVILPTRARQLSLFARPRANRFDIGFSVNIKPEAHAELNEQEIDQLKKEEVPQVRELMLNCGTNESYRDREKRTLAQFVMETAEDALTFGEFAVEFRRDSNQQFHSFRAMDAGTVFRTTPQGGESREAENIRVQSKRILEQLQGHKIDISKFQNDEYTWAQVINGRPDQVFTDDECIVMSMSPSTDINRQGYPISPLERIVSAIGTHINLTTQNKMYFINGRQARTALVFKSEDLEKQDIENIRIQMAAHINSVNSAHRMPVFGIKPTDSVETVPLDGGNRDMEFQYLADLNKRMIFAAFQMSPDEVAALSYLSRGTNSQAMSESNNEFKLIAARDTGLRPLLMLYEDFFNERLLPRISKRWAKYLRIDFEGLDQDSPEKEATRLQQDANLYLNMDDIMERVEKDKLPIGGAFPLNPAYMGVLEKYYTKGQILKALGGKGFEQADRDPDLSYCMNDPTSVQVYMMKKQMEMQQQMGPQQDPNQTQQQGQGQEQQPQQDTQELDGAISQLGSLLNKSETKSPQRKELHRKYEKVKKDIMKSFEKEAQRSLDDILGAITGSKEDKT